ncbi:MAG: L-fucose/L-arabinose isomerase family protein [Anaerolineae bacterium]
MKKVRLGFVPTHRFPFDEQWAVEMRHRCMDVMEKMPEVELVVPGVALIHNGLVRDDASAQATIDLFADRQVQGLVIGTMTFGDEVAAISIAEALDVPVLVFGTKEGPFTSDGKRHSDSFCGTLSVTSGMYRHKIPYVFGGIIFPEEDEFSRTLHAFASTCAAVTSFIGTRVGMVGLRPERFETCNTNEVALMNTFGQRVIPLNLSDLFAKAAAWPEDDYRLLATLEAMKAEANCSACHPKSLVKAAQLELTLARFAQEKQLSSMGISCWNDVQEQFGICACTTLGRLTEQGIMAACEVDVIGALTMLVQYQAVLETTVPHFVDWTIQHQEWDDVFLAWHCGNAPACLAADRRQVVVREQAIMSTVVGADRSEMAMDTQLAPGTVTLNRLVEYDGEFKMLITNGEILPSEDNLRGSWSWVQVPDLKHLYRVLAEEGFTHHVSMIHGDVSDAVEDFCQFTGIDVVRI